MANYGNWAKGDCKSDGTRTYSARLWNIVGSWEDACANQPVSVAGINRPKADRCINKGTEMWGEVDVPDSTCNPNWLTWQRGDCTPNGSRTYSAQLWNIIGSWEDACTRQPVSVAGVNKPKADRCINKGSGMWGEVDVPDSSCAPKWATWQKGECTSNDMRKYSAQCVADKWEACDGIGTTLQFPATVDGKPITTTSGPIRKVNERWGEVTVQDPSCNAKWSNWIKGDCTSQSNRIYSSQLTNVTGDWDVACQNQPVTVAGQNKPKPDRCINKGASGIWGEVEVPDNTCLPTWGDWRKDDCISNGIRKYSSQCKADKWEVCDNANLLKFPPTVNGKTVVKSTGPIRVANERWGEVNVQDDSCSAKWGDWAKNDCNADGKRTYSSKLLNITGDWNAVCNSQAVSVQGVSKAKPDRCIDKGVAGQWGEVDVSDTTCMPTWGDWKKDNCLDKTTRKYSSQCHADKWEACDKIGTLLPFPKTVDNKAVLTSNGPIKVGEARWGEVTVKEENCVDPSILGSILGSIGLGSFGNIGVIFMMIGIILLIVFVIYILLKLKK